MRRITVTGADGRTSTVEFVRQPLDAAERRSASDGTLNPVTAEDLEPGSRAASSRRRSPSSSYHEHPCTSLQLQSKLEILYYFGTN